MNLEEIPGNTPEKPASAEMLTEVPEGWKFFTQIQKEIGCTSDALRVVINKAMAELPDSFQYEKYTRNGSALTQYLSPVVEERVKKHFQEFPVMPMDHYTALEAANKISSPEHRPTILKVIEILKSKGIIIPRQFTDRNGAIVEGFSKTIIAETKKFIKDIRSSRVNNNA
ncbi:MAG: hypothetical protein V4486_01610 [Patescibacteria group bacterium]